MIINTLKGLFTKKTSHKKNKMKQIIIIDDDIDALYILKRFLSNTGISTIAFHDEVKAMDFIEKINESKDIILIVDIHLTSINGFKIAQFIQNRLQRKIPIIYISASDQNRNKYWQKADISTSYFLEKPFKRKELINVLERFTQKRIT